MSIEKNACLKHTMYTIPESLPVRGLSGAVDIYLRSLLPLVDSEGYEQTALKAERFVENEGAVLHKRLMEYASSIAPENWLAGRLLDSYLLMRRPIAIESNYILEAMPPLPDNMDYLERVAITVYALALVFKELKDGSFPAMSIKKRDGSEVPLCMKQYKMAFRCAKIPKKDKDELVIFDYADITGFGVFYKNQYYKLQIVKDGEIADVKCIYAALREIYKADREVTDVGFAAASFAGSDMAAVLIEKLCEDNAANTHAFDELYKSMFNVTLCDATRESRPPVDLLLGKAADFWAYSPMSIFAHTDGMLCFNYEHTPLDGLTNMNLIKRAFDKIKEFGDIDFTCVMRDGAVGVGKIGFDISAVYNELAAVKAEYLLEAAQYGMRRYNVKNLPVSELKKIGVSPDTYLQTAYLYAQMATYGELKCTHESVSVTQFNEARTACVRSASVWAKELYRAVHSVNEGSEDIEALELLLKAEVEQKVKINAAKEFCCFVRLSQGLLLMHEMFGEELGVNERPEIFTDENYARYLSQEVSTSTVGNAPYIYSFAFAPQEPGGLGIGYVTKGDALFASISYYENEKQAVLRFVKGLDEFFGKMGEIVRSSAK